jgi:hypothetical protein
MPNPYKANGTSDENSQVPTPAAGSSSESRNNRGSHGGLLDPSSSRDSTIIFGLTTKSDINEQRIESIEASEPKGGVPLRRSYCIYDLSDPEETAAIAWMERSSSSLPRVPLTKPTSRGNLNVPEVVANAERRPSRRNAPLQRTASVVDINDAEEMANAEREEIEMRPTPQTQSPGVNNPTNIVRQQPPTSRRNAPLRRTISIHDFDDLEEVANAERLENLLHIFCPGPTVSIDREEPATVHSSEPRTNEPLRRAFSVSDINDPIEVARAETLTTARASPQGPSVGVSQRVRERLTASAESSSSNIIRGKRPRDSDGDEEERMQKKTRIGEASN